MPLNLQNQEFQVSCPSCGAQITLKFKEVGSTKQITLKFKEVGSTKVCPKCKNKIHFKDDNFKKDLKKVETEFKKLEKQLKNFNK